MASTARYLDGDSRAAGNGTSNYVIFDDSLINIAERGNATVPMLGATALGSAGVLAAPNLMKDGFESTQRPRRRSWRGSGRCNQEVCRSLSPTLMMRSSRALNTRLGHVATGAV